MNLLQVNFENTETILNDFERIAELFKKGIAIKINLCYYRLIDFEFYAFSENFPDPQTHKSEHQLENGKIYLHSSGIDITFGDGNNYGGILIRGVVLVNDEGNDFTIKQFDGPQIVATELFSKLHCLLENKPNEISLVEIEERKQDVSYLPYCIKTKRVGLTPKKLDKVDYYLNLPLRYIIVLENYPNFKQKIKGIENFLVEEIKNKRIKEDEAQNILGYKKTF
jgi:hypothetical protein